MHCILDDFALLYKYFTQMKDFQILLNIYECIYAFITIIYRTLNIGYFMITHEDTITKIVTNDGKYEIKTS